MVSCKYLTNFWKTLQIPLINCEINFVLTWSADCVMASNTAANQETKKFAKTGENFMLHL